MVNVAEGYRTIDSMASWANSMGGLIDKATPIAINGYKWNNGFIFAIHAGISCPDANASLPGPSVDGGTHIEKSQPFWWRYLAMGF